MGRYARDKRHASGSWGTCETALRIRDAVAQHSSFGHQGIIELTHILRVGSFGVIAVETILHLVKSCGGIGQFNRLVDVLLMDDFCSVGRVRISGEGDLGVVDDGS